MKADSMNTKAWGARIMNASIAAAWIVLVAAFIVINGCYGLAPQHPAEPKPVSLNCDGCLNLPSDAILIDGVLNYYIYGTTQIYTVQGMSKAILLTERLTDIRAMRLHIFSGGGDAFTSMGMADVVTSAQERGWSVEAYAKGIIASAAVPVFSVCYPRYAAFGTLFMVHPVQGGEIDTAMRDKWTDKYITYLVLMTKVGRVEWRKMLDDTTWFTAEEALEWGLVDAIY